MCYNRDTKALLNLTNGEYPTMKIGSIIKKQRQARDLTQEQLAEYLNVSVSAVSQWESGKTVPDIATILSLANFFSITLDELFDRTSGDKEKAMEEYDRLEREYANRGEVVKLVALWREAVQKYPGEFRCLDGLARALHEAVYSGGDSEEIENNAKECVAIAERILRDCTDSDIRNSAIQQLVHMHSHKDLSIANEEKAVQYAKMAGGMFTSRQRLLEHAYFTEESKEKRRAVKHRNNLNYMDLLTMNLYYGQYPTAEEKIRACRAALTLWETLIYDGNYLFFHSRIQEIYSNMAWGYAKQQNREETIQALKMALHHAKCYDELPAGEQHYTSALVNAATDDKAGFTKNYTATNQQNVLTFMKHKCFDFVRDDPAFVELAEGGK